MGIKEGHGRVTASGNLERGEEMADKISYSAPIDMLHFKTYQYWPEECSECHDGVPVYQVKMDSGETLLLHETHLEAESDE